MVSRRHVLLLLTALLFAVLLASDRSEGHLLNPVDCYAVLAVCANDANATVRRNLDPLDVNGIEIGLARVYGALKEAGFKDSHIIILYCSGGLQPDWSEKKNAKEFKMLRQKHFSRRALAATKANIESAISSVKEKLDENDQFVLWLMAHGIANGTIQLSGGTWNPSLAQRALSGLKSRTNWFLIDSCFSGVVVDRFNVDNVFIFSTTGSRTPGWIDRNHCNCATFLECKNDEKLDKNKDGIVDYQEAYDETRRLAKKYDPKLKDYLRTKYKPSQPIPRSMLLKAGLIPKMKVGNSFVKSNLGPGSGDEKEQPKKGTKKKGRKRTRTRRKVDTGKALMKKAALYESGKDYVTAIDTYKKVAEMGENSRYSKEAVRKRDKLLSNKKIAAEYEAAQLEKKLDEDLMVAESYYLAREYDKTIEYCEKVIKAAPDSKQAKSARSLIRQAREVKRLER